MAILDPVFGELEAGGAEGIRFEDVDPDCTERRMNLFDDIRASHRENIVAPFLTAKVLGREVIRLNRHAHGAVEDKHAVRENVEELWLECMHW